MHNHVDTKGIIVSNELKLIEEAKNNSLLELLSGLPYVVWDVMVVRKQGTDLVVEADPYGWVGVAATPLDNELELLGQMCNSYEAIVGSYDPMTQGKRSHVSAAGQAIEAFLLRSHLDGLDIEWRPSGRFGVVISSLSFHLADLEVSSNAWGETSAKTPVGVYTFTPSGDGEEVTLSLWL